MPGVGHPGSAQMGSGDGASGAVAFAGGHPHMDESVHKPACMQPHVWMSLVCSFSFLSSCGVASAVRFQRFICAKLYKQ